MAQKIFTTDSWNEFTAGIVDLNEKVKSTNIAYGTCSTAAATVEKVITISGDYNWKLEIGSIIVVKFSATNTAKNPTFNVNGTGAKSVWYNTALITTSSSTLGYAGTANRPMMFMYDGTQYVFISWAYDTNSTYSNASLGQGYGTCATAEATTAKEVTLSSYAFSTGGIVAVKFTYAVPANATMNINSKGAKNIFYRGAAITAGIIKAGDIATFMYDGTQYHLLAVDRDENNTYTLGSFGVTATASELNVLDGITATTTELNYVDGVTSNIQTQIDNITNGTKTVSKATSATSAIYATTATKAGSATSATNASTADYASLANKATSATYASTATKAGTANSASTATVDSKGQAITGYIKGFGINGKTITITKGDGSTTSYTTQDNNTTYSKATTSTLGLVKIGYPESGKNYPVELNSDGQMFVNVPWTDNNTTYANYKGATTAASGTAGLVPVATTATRTSFLRGDGTWATPSNATSATIATSATYATNAGTASYASSSNSASKATSATSATYATTATNAGTSSYSSNAAKATSATSATYATTATKAGTADSATKATSATSATYATTATNAGTSTYATSAGSATNASTATYASSANKATSATSATYASTATKAGTATYATNSGTASYATLADSATKATSATSATYSSTATYAKNVASHTHTKSQITDFPTSIHGVVVDVLSSNWVNQNNLYTNTITMSGVTANSIFDVSVYGDVTEAQAEAFDFLVTSIDTQSGKIVLTSNNSISVDFSILLREVSIS